MKQLFAIELGHRRGIIAVVAKFDYTNKTATFQTHVNGLPIFESENYEQARYIALNIHELNEQKELAN